MPKPDPRAAARCAVHHAHLYGPRMGQGGKYDFLKTHDKTSTPWQPLTPDEPFYLLTPQNVDLRR